MVTGRNRSMADGHREKLVVTRLVVWDRVHDKKKKKKKKKTQLGLMVTDRNSNMNDRHRRLMVTE